MHYARRQLHLPTDGRHLHQLIWSGEPLEERQTCQSVIILCHYQHGSRKLCSCQTILLGFTDELTSNLEISDSPNSRHSDGLRKGIRQGEPLPTCPKTPSLRYQKHNPYLDFKFPPWTKAGRRRQRIKIGFHPCHAGSTTRIGTRPLSISGLHERSGRASVLRTSPTDARLNNILPQTVRE
ncbi:hypothetical protein BaRGS_00030377 [Batillaria attramentaria]|uniref:Uncharacterized protein n=1 Tax=Batillaria attramentaria TaxID=370345 RepID=A0ABD0JU36_9CAEN